MCKIWKDVFGYEGLYKVSSTGEIFSIRKNKILKGSLSKKYIHVTLCNNGTIKSFNIHRLVAKAFISNYSDDLEVDHIDNNQLNNNVENLRMCTSSQNKNNINSNTCKPCRIYFKNGEIKEFTSTYECDRKCGFIKGVTKRYIKDKRSSRKYQFKKVEYINENK